MTAVAFPARARARLLALALVACCGCGTVKVSGTARTATEQLLLTNAWDTALQKVDFRPLMGVPVYLDTTNISAIDQGWVISSLKQAMLAQGVLLRSKAEQAQWIVEARVGVYGTDGYNWMAGIQQTTIPPTFTGIPTGTVPEIAFIKKSNQQGMAKLALFGYDRASGHMVWSSGTMLATSNAKDIYIGGVGPIQSGSIRGGTDFIGIRIPLTSDPAATDGKEPRAVLPPSTGTSLAIPPGSTDLESFAP